MAIRQQLKRSSVISNQDFDITDHDPIEWTGGPFKPSFGLSGQFAEILSRPLGKRNLLTHTFESENSTGKLADHFARIVKLDIERS